MGSQLFWLDESGIANVISLRTLEDNNSSKRKRAFVWETPEGEVIFHRCRETGFPYIDLDKQGRDENKQGRDEAVQFVQTVRKNVEGFT